MNVHDRSSHEVWWDSDKTRRQPSLGACTIYLLSGRPSGRLALEVEEVAVLRAPRERLRADLHVRVCDGLLMAMLVREVLDHGERTEEGHEAKADKRDLLPLLHHLNVLCVRARKHAPSAALGGHARHELPHKE
eukprot:CAMPEP_0119414216 /NCGR_PEP_ID=MMETSP1335-20130426/6660_1 /TAXON_ID=259385 /ORGANISM="Chrysoculter rhomboideus, Strain RCC1486" /LENGTH=133 /DNA_ID=CAMNT_0007439081 /DNA_START=189 /DNA_END=590 /DNA_ORIENTATION=-